MANLAGLHSTSQMGEVPSPGMQQQAQDEFPTPSQAEWVNTAEPPLEQGQRKKAPPLPGPPGKQAAVFSSSRGLFILGQIQ